MIGPIEDARFTDESFEDGGLDLVNDEEIEDEVGAREEGDDVEREEGTRASARRSKCNICR